MCPNCNEDFEVFCDDGRNDTVVCWNWCPHCYKRVDMWIKFKSPNERFPVGLTCEEATKKQEEINGKRDASVS
jgi:hypothetical protein